MRQDTDSLPPEIKRASPASHGRSTRSKRQAG